MHGEGKRSMDNTGETEPPLKSVQMVPICPTPLNPPSHVNRADNEFSAGELYL